MIPSPPPTELALRSVFASAPEFPPTIEYVEAPPRHLRDYIWVLFKHRVLAAACFAATVAVALLIVVFAPRRYTAATRVEVSYRSPIQLRLQDSVLRVADGDRDDVVTFLATQVAALQSRDLAERVIRRRGLAADPIFVNPKGAPGEPLAGAGSLAEEFRPRGLEPSTGAIATNDSPVEPKLLDRYMSYLSVRRVPDTVLIQVSFTTPSPSLSAFLAAAHTEAYLEANEDARRSTDAVARRFLDQQLTDAQGRIQRAETALGKFAAEHPSVAANQEQKVTAQQITDLSSRLNKAEAERVNLESRYSFLTGKGGQPKAYFLDRPAIQKLRLALLDLRAQHVGLDQRLGPNHPQMQELRQLEAEVGRQLDVEVAQEVAGAGARYQAARLRAKQLGRRIAQIERRDIKLRDLGTRYDLLKRDVDAAHGLHTSLLKQQTDTGVNAQLAASNVRVIERPELPTRPSRPNVPLDMTLGIAAGLVFAVGAAFARDYFDSSLKSSEETEELLRCPTLATIPNFQAAQPPRSRLLELRSLLGASNGHDDTEHPGEHADGNGHPHTNGARTEADDLVVLRAPWSGAAEAFRGMRTALLFSTPDTPPKVLLMTSARAGEGKTMSSLNLAVTLAESGARVILIDADLRHPRCHGALGVDNAQGLTNYLAGEGELDALVRVLDVPPISFLSAGPVPANPARLVGSGRMRRLLVDLRLEYDFVIIDTPPVLPVTDAVVLAREADGVVLVVKGHDTPRVLVRRARDRLAMAGTPFLGVIVNNVDLHWGDLYYVNPRYRYGQPPRTADWA